MAVLVVAAHRETPAVQALGQRVIAAGVLAQRGYKVTVYEQRKRLGGMTNLIPDFRLDKRVPRRDIQFTKALGVIDFQMGKAITDPEALLERYKAVIVSAGGILPSDFLRGIGVEVEPALPVALSAPVPKRRTASARAAANPSSRPS